MQLYTKMLYICVFEMIYKSKHISEKMVKERFHDDKVEDRWKVGAKFVYGEFCLVFG